MATSAVGILKRIAARLPLSWQLELKRAHFRRLIRRDRFVSDEPEFDLLAEWIGPGDWVIDVGANVGHYTKRLSELVGATGRVVAVEPVAATFALLAGNVQLFRFQNVTLINAAASSSAGVAGLDLPRFGSGLDNYYRAHLSGSEDPRFRTLTLPLDALPLPHTVALVKIDAEGHEPSVLAGMSELLRRDRPVLLVETFSDDVVRTLSTLGYSATRHPGSPNLVFIPGP